MIKLYDTKGVPTNILLAYKDGYFTTQQVKVAKKGVNIGKEYVTTLLTFKTLAHLSRGIYRHYNIELTVDELSPSCKMVIREEGIELGRAKEKGKVNFKGFIKKNVDGVC